MKVDVFDLEGKKKGSIDLPSQFSEDYEPNLVKRAVLAFLSKLRQSYGADPRGGMRHHAKLSRRRRDFKGGYNKGISRVPRKILWRRGMQFGWAGAVAPGMVGGRKAHPPKGEKIWKVKINKKENSKALRSALGGLVEEKKIKVVVDGLESLKKTKEVQDVFVKLGFSDELKRLNDRKVRAGKGKTRGRKYRNKVGPLVVVSKESKAFDNLLGFDCAIVNSLNINLLTQGHENLRQVIITESAVKQMKEKNLFGGRK